MPIERILDMQKEFPVGDIIEGDRGRQDYGDMDEFAETIAAYGILQPLVIRQDNLLLAGGRRLRAARQLKIKKVPIVKVETKGEVEDLEIELIENVGRKDMHWSERCRLEKKIFSFRLERDKDWAQSKQAKMLGVSPSTMTRRLQLAEYLDIVPELAEEEGITQAFSRVKRMIQDHEVKKSLKKREQEEESKKPVRPTKGRKQEAEAAQEVGMWWAEDSYKIGDAIKGLSKVRAGSYYFAEVDPPYAIDLGDKSKRLKDSHHTDSYEEISPDEYPNFVQAVAKLVFRALRPDTFCVWWYAPEWYSLVCSSLEEGGFKINKVPAIWVKGQTGQSNAPETNLAGCYEPFIVARKGSPRLFKPGRSNVFAFEPVRPSEKYHRTQRPETLMREIIETFCPKNGWLISPFLGSGTTLVSAFLSDRRGIGWDLVSSIRDHYLLRAKQVKKEWKRDAVSN